MAKLTDTIQSETRGPQTVDPGQSGSVGGDIFSGIVGLGSALFGAEKSAQATEKQRQATANANTKFQQDQTDRAATEAATNVGLGAFDVTDASAPQATAQAGQVGQQLSDANAAVSQGRMTTAAYNLRSKTLLAPVLAAFPNSHAAIYAQLKNMGIDNMFTRDYDQIVKDEDSAADGVRKANEAAVATATTEGGFDPNTTSQTVLQDEGRKILKEKANLARMQVDQQMSLADKNASREDLEFQKKNTSEEALESITNSVAPVLASVNNNMQKLANDPTIPDTVKVQKLQELAQTVDAAASGLINQKMIQYGGVLGASAGEARTRLETYRTQLRDLITGPLSTIQQNSRTLTSIQTSLGISTARALPFVTALKNSLGPASAQILADTLQANSGGISAKISAELKNVGMNGFETPQGHVALQNVIGIMKGEKGFKDMTAAEARTALPELSRTFVQHLKPDLIDKDPQAQKVALNVGAQIANAAVELSPSSGADALGTATTLLTSNPVKYLLGKSTGGENKALVMTVAPAMRAGAQQVYESWKGTKTDDPYFDTSYNKVTGRWELLRNKNQPTPQSSGNVARFGYLPDPVIKPSSISQKKVDGLNKTLGFLVETAPAFEDQVNIKGATPKQLREFYGQGVPLPSMKNKETGQTDPDAWAKNVESIRKQAVGILSGLDFNPVNTSTEGVAGKIAKVEGTGKNPKSSAVGVGQLVDGTWVDQYRRTIDPNASKEEALSHRGDITIQKKLHEGLTSYNQTKLSEAGVPVTDGNTYLAHFLGMGGATRVLRNPDESLEALLGPDVIKANPFLAGHDAKWVIQWAERKMNG